MIKYRIMLFYKKPAYLEILATSESSGRAQEMLRINEENSL